MQKIETQHDYINLVRDSRSNSFTIVGKEECSVKDFETLIKQNVKMPKKFQIRKAVKISYSNFPPSLFVFGMCPLEFFTLLHLKLLIYW